VAGSAVGEDAGQQLLGRGVKVELPMSGGGVQQLQVGAPELGLGPADVSAQVGELLQRLAELRASLQETANAVGVPQNLESTAAAGRDVLASMSDTLDTQLAAAQENVSAGQAVLQTLRRDLDVAMGDSRIQLLVFLALFLAFFIIPVVVSGLYDKAVDVAKSVQQSWREAEKGEDNVISSVWDFAKDLTAGQLAEKAEKERAENEAKESARWLEFILPWWLKDQTLADLEPRRGEENVTLELLLLAVLCLIMFSFAINTESFLAP